MTSTLSSRLLHGVVRTRERLEAVVAMDAGLPYLDHHRPGGEPLFGTVLGIFILRVMRNGIVLIGVPGLAYNIFIGAIILGMMALHSWLERRHQAGT